MQFFQIRLHVNDIAVLRYIEVQRDAQRKRISVDQVPVCCCFACSWVQSNNFGDENGSHLLSIFIDMCRLTEDFLDLCDWQANGDGPYKK